MLRGLSRSFSVAWHECAEACAQSPRAAGVSELHRRKRGLLVCAAMPRMLCQIVRKESLGFQAQRRVVILRDVHRLPFRTIARRVRNLSRKASTKDTVRRAYHGFSDKHGFRPYKYANCGRRAVRMTPATVSFLVKMVRAHRLRCVCTPTTLQRLAHEHLGVALDTSHIRKALRSRGYYWLRRRGLRRYSPGDKRRRWAFAQRIADMTPSKARQLLAFAMDGVVLAMPPTDPVDRQNYCAHGDTHMWRKHSEGNDPLLAGNDDYPQQVPLERAIPLWGGISDGGFAPVVFHKKKKKLTAAEWSATVRRGRLLAAVRRVAPAGRAGPWHVLCDNEAFLRAGASQAAYAADNIRLLDMPPRSPDLNPVERFWAWLRKQLRLRDLADASGGRPVPSKAAYRNRVRQVLQTQKAQRVAAACARSWRATCKLVASRQDAASGK